MNQEPDPYALLGVAPTATAADITKAFRDRVRALHPDSRTTSAHTTQDDDLQLRLVLSAYVQLRHRLGHRRTECGDCDVEEAVPLTQPERPTPRTPSDRSAWFAAGRVYREQ